MITHENIEFVHHFLQVAKAPFKEMLMQLLAEYRAGLYTGTHGDIRCTGG